MGIQIKVTDNFLDAAQAIDDIKRKVLVTATRQAINKTISKTKTRVNQKIREKYKLKVRDVNQSMTVKRASGSNIGAMGGFIRVDGEPISMRKFMKGSQSPPRPDAQGKAPKKRSKIKFEIRPGKQVVLSKTFFAQANTSKGVVFSREGKKRLQIIARKVKAVSLVVAEPQVRRDLEKFISSEYSRIFEKQVEFNLDKLASKMKKK